MTCAADTAYLLHKGKNAFWLLAFLACFRQSIGQNITFNHLTAENGLSHNAVLAIVQDSRGFMWYGTAIGLNRYDGHHFRIYKTNRADSNSISNNNILSLLSDLQHNLWIGTSNGLNKYDIRKDAFQRIYFNPTNVSGKANSIFCLYEDKKGNLWVGTGNGLFLLTNKQKNTFQGFYVHPSTHLFAGSEVHSVYEDHNGRLWVGTSNGLIKMIPVKGKWQCETFRYDINNAGSLSANYVTTIMEDAHQNLWVGTQNGGINLYNPSNNSFTRFLHNDRNPSGLINNNIRKIICDKTGKLWIGTQEGLSIIDPVSKQIQSYQHDAGNKKSLSQNSIYSLFEDASGSVWIGTYFGGLNAVYPYTTSFTVLQNNDNRSSINNNVISSIVEDEKHNLWIGTEGGGLNYWNRTTGIFTTFTSKPDIPSSLGSNLVKVVYKDQDGNIWAGTHGGGLNVFDATKGVFKRSLYKENDATTLNSEVIALLEDHTGRFWAGTNLGLKVFHRNKTTLEPWPDHYLTSQTADLFAKALLEDAQKRIWIGTSSGLYILVHNTLKKISGDYINCLMEDTKGNIWAGLYYDGLAKYDIEKQHFIYYTEKEGLPNNNVIGILEDDEANLWLSTDNGLIKFNPEQKTFQAYTISDGLADNAFNYNSFFKDSRGEFFFGGYNGLTRFFPDKIEVNHYTAPIVFTALKLFNQPIIVNGKDHLLKQNISTAKQLTFQYNQDVFTIEFALLNFIKSNKNKYAYKLEGFDKGWNETTTPSVTYTNLPSGTYTLWIKGANNDGLWSRAAALKINVLPPFWLTWWAYCLYILILTALSFLIIRFFFLRALLKKESELHQVKLNFFTNISHEIRTHLTLIMTPVEKMLEVKELNEMNYRQLLNVKNNAGRLLKLVSELMDFRKAETDHLQLHVAQHDLIAFLQEIHNSFSELSLAKHIKSSFVHNADTILLYFDKEQLEKVFFNLLTNAFKFTPAGGHICMNVEQKDNSVIVSVTDNGRGIAPEHLNNIFTNFFQVADHGIQNTGYGIGLALSKKIVELHQGTITVQSTPATHDKESSTSFIVSLLPGSKHFEGSPHMVQPPFEKAIKTEPGVSAFPPILPLNNENEGKTFTILIVEDNPELRALIKDTFKNQYRVLEGNHGGEGWQMAVEQLPDMIISDVMMPEMDGFTLCSKLKTDERTSHIPVILLTAKSAQTDQVYGLENGADVYITKPFSAKVLALNVRNLLTLRERMRQRFSKQISAENPVLNMLPIETAGDAFVNNVDEEFIKKVIRLVEEHMDDPEFGVDMLAKKVAMSQPVLYKKLKAVTNMSVNDFVKTLRLKKAAQLLKQKQFTVYEVAYAVGYNDRKYFSKEFKKQFGKTPSEYAGLEEMKRI